MKTTSISFRVPEDFKAQLLEICNSQGISMTDYCLSRITPSTAIAPVNAQVLHKLAKGGPVSDTIIPNDLQDVLSVTGGLLVGGIVYKSLSDVLKEKYPEWTDEKLQAISVAAGLMSAILSGVGINKLLTSGK